MGLTFDLKGDAYDKLDKIIAACNDGKPAMTTIGRVLTNRIKLGFKNGRSPYGDTWKPLKYRDGQPLRDKGLLQNSITYNAESDSVSIGTNAIQAKVQNFGAVITPRTAKTLRFFIGNRAIFAKQVVIPSRLFMPIVGNDVVLPQDWLKATVKALQDHIESQL